MQDHYTAVTADQFDYHTHRIPVLLHAGGQRLLLFYEGRVNSHSDRGDINLMCMHSDDGGRSFSEPAVVIDEGPGLEVTWGNPCPIFDRDGTVHLLCTRDNHSAHYLRSDDRGQTFTDPRDITDVCRQFGFQWGRVATGPVHGLQMTGGRLIVPLWLHEGTGPDRGEGEYRSGVLASDDGGATWLAAGLVDAPGTHGSCNECVAAELPDGQLMLNMRSNRKPRRIVSLSPDGGKTWSSPQPDETLICPTCQASLLSVPAGLAGRDGVMLFSNPAREGPQGTEHGPREAMTVRTSFDCGKTWPRSMQINDDLAGYSDLAVLPDATVVLAYEGGTERYSQDIRIARIPLAELL